VLGVARSAGRYYCWQKASGAGRRCSSEREGKKSLREITFCNLDFPQPKSLSSPEIPFVPLLVLGQVEYCDDLKLPSFGGFHHAFYQHGRTRRK